MIDEGFAGPASGKFSPQIEGGAAHRLEKQTEIRGLVQIREKCEFEISTLRVEIFGLNERGLGDRG